MPFIIKKNNSDLCNPKTPYNEDEMSNGFLTNIKERIAVYKHKGYAERVKKELNLHDFTVEEIK